MRLKFFLSQGIRIHFFDSETPDADSLIFIHGNSHTARTFQGQLAAPELAKFRRIAVDLPGHGDSETASDYSLALFVAVIRDLVAEYQLERFVLVGHSLGGHVALHSLRALDPMGVFVWGAPPLTKPLDMRGFRSPPEMGALFKNEVTDAEVLDLLRIMNLERRVTEADLADFRKTDIQFREKMIRSFGEGQFEDESLLLGSYRGKITLLAPTQDQLVDGDYIQTSFPHVTLPVAGPHNLHLESPDAFNHHLAAFCETTFFSQGQILYEHRTGKDIPYLEGHATPPWAHSEGSGPSAGHLPG